MVEPKNDVIWKFIHQYYGEDFLLECIEEEYGVTSKSSEKLQMQMDIQLQTMQGNYLKKLDELKSTYLGQINTLNK